MNWYRRDRLFVSPLLEITERLDLVQPLGAPNAKAGIALPGARKPDRTARETPLQGRWGP